MDSESVDMEAYNTRNQVDFYKQLKRQLLESADKYNKEGKKELARTIMTAISEA